jgi:outer membrane murein-binding lipoprotein Lpp
MTLFPVKNISFLFCLTLAALLVIGGTACSKKNQAAAAPASLPATLAHLRTSLENASPEVQSNLWAGVSSQTRYGNYPVALATLQHMSTDTSLTAEQKQAITDTIQAIQREMAAAPAAPPQ